MDKKQFMEMCKALSNETRVNILIWLKDPEKHFPGKKLHLSPDTADCPGGICVGSIQDKAGISQSTISHYLDAAACRLIVDRTRWALDLLSPQRTSVTGTIPFHRPRLIA